MNNFQILNGDTDSITVFKDNFETFLLDQRKELLLDLNSKCPEGLVWEDDGYFSYVIVIRAKNYVLLNENGKLTIKGSALKASTKSPKMKQFIKDIINSILTEKNNYLEIYNTYAKEIVSIVDIKPWATRKTITDKVLSGTRKNETNVADAIVGSNLREGDRCHMFYKNDGTLCLAENFKEDYSQDRLYLQLYDSMCVFDTILDMSVIKNYKLKKNKKDIVLL